MDPDFYVRWPATVTLDDSTVAVLLVSAFVGALLLWVNALVGAWQRARNAPPAAAPAPPDTPTIERVEHVAAALRRRPLDAQDTDTDCGICLDKLKDAVEFLPCGHLFCAPCALQYLSSFDRPTLLCPADRGAVEVIFPSFRRRRVQAAEERASNTPLTAAEVAAVARVDEQLSRFNQRQRDWRHGTARGHLAVARYGLREFFTLPFQLRLRIGLAFFLMALYALSPMDLIPEAVFGAAGLVDDVMVIILFVVVVSHVARRAFAQGAWV